MLVLGLLLAGCTGMPPMPPRHEPLTPPDRFRSVVPQDTTAPPAGWRSPEDPELEAWILSALRHNADLRSAEARIGQARALARLDQAAGSPMVSLNPQASRARSLPHTQGVTRIAATTEAPPTLYASRSRLPLDVSWEADLWGRLAQTRHASDLRAAASTADLQAARLSLTAAVITTYHRLQLHDRRQPLLEELVQLSERRVLAHDIRRRSAMQDGGLLELARLDSIEARSRLLQARERAEQDRHALAELCGLSSATELPETFARPLPDPLEPLPADFPGHMLLRRPDVQGALIRLEATWSDLVATRADFLPALRISATIGLESSMLSELLQPGSGIWSLSAQLGQALLDGGRRNARFDLAHARWREAAAQYEATVHLSLREAEDALTTATALRSRWHMETQALATAQRLSAQARHRADAGLASRLDTLEQRQAALRRELSLLDLRAQVLEARVAVHKTLAWP